MSGWQLIVDSMSTGDILRRTPGLVEHFGQPSDEPVIACANVDRTHLPEVEGIAPPLPSIEHSIVQCVCCGDAVWIGPAQKTVPSLRVCYLCLAILYTHTGTTPTTVALNPDIDQVPRRAG